MATQDFGALQQTLSQLVSPLTTAQFFYKPAPEVWSMAEILEHIYRVNRSVVKGFAHFAPSEETVASIAGKIAYFLNNRERKIQSPDFAKPKGENIEQEALLNSVNEHLAQLADTQNQLGEGVIKIIMPHPMLGQLNGADWLFFVVAHTNRHIVQMQELMARPDFLKA